MDTIDVSAGGYVLRVQGGVEAFSDTPSEGVSSVLVEVADKFCDICDLRFALREEVFINYVDHFRVVLFEPVSNPNLPGVERDKYHLPRVFYPRGDGSRERAGDVRLKKIVPGDIGQADF